MRLDVYNAGGLNPRSQQPSNSPRLCGYPILSQKDTQNWHISCFFTRLPCVRALRRMVWKSICKDSLNLNTCLLESFLRLDLVLREKQATSIETKHMMSPDPLPESFLGVLHLREPKIMVTLLPSVTYASSTSYKCSILFGNM